MAKLGFLGLGIMGGPMARHLLEAGHDVALWSYSADKAQAAATGKGVACATPAEVAERSDCVFLCVGDTEMSDIGCLSARSIFWMLHALDRRRARRTVR
jgi:3-hydroxyisobutyrate dehydrogenase-like beta-hydroxyacid dehydrogenase